MDSFSLGQKIREARLAKGMTQADLAKIIGYSSAMAISHFEKGTRSIRTAELQRIFEVLGISMSSPKKATTLFRATNARGGASMTERSLDAFDRLVQEKYGNDA